MALSFLFWEAQIQDSSSGEWYHSHLPKSPLEYPETTFLLFPKPRLTLPIL
jgi:hypothetical protein